MDFLSAKVLHASSSSLLLTMLRRSEEEEEEQEEGAQQQQQRKKAMPAATVNYLIHSHALACLSRTYARGLGGRERSRSC
jgi:hypothetical protein